ncbi:MAG: hypothetical protein ACK494_19825, partial [Planctomycetota bacterium]
RTINEDTAYTFAEADFGFTDPLDSPANTFTAVTITTLPPATDGVLRLSGAAVTAGQSILVANIPNLTFTPADNVNGNARGAFTFQVQDNGATNNIDLSANSFAFNINSVADAPAGTDATRTVNEHTAYGSSILNVSNLRLQYEQSTGNWVNATSSQATVSFKSLESTSTATLGSFMQSNTQPNLNAAMSFLSPSFFPPVEQVGVPLQSYTNLGMGLNTSGDFAIADTNGVGDTIVGGSISVSTLAESNALSSETAEAMGDLNAFNRFRVTTSQSGNYRIVFDANLSMQTTGDGVADVDFSVVVNGGSPPIAYAPSELNRTISGNSVVNMATTFFETQSTFLLAAQITTFDIIQTSSTSASVIPEPSSMAYRFAAADFGFSDPLDVPADTFTAVTISTLPLATEGVLRLSGVAVTAGQSILVANLPTLTCTPAATVHGNARGAVTYQVQDNGATNNIDLSPNSFAFNIILVADAPAGTDATRTINEDTAYTFAEADFGFTDPLDSPANTFTAVTITTLPPATD